MYLYILHRTKVNYFTINLMYHVFHQYKSVIVWSVVNILIFNSVN